MSCSSGSPSDRRVPRPLRLPRHRRRRHRPRRRHIIKITDLNLADSALHAPAAGFGDTDFYPDFVDKAAMLIVRLARNHPLPDGNKLAARASLRAFIDINGWRWEPVPSVDDAEQAVLAIAAGEWSEAETAEWLREHLVPSE